MNDVPEALELLSTRVDELEKRVHALEHTAEGSAPAIQTSSAVAQPLGEVVKGSGIDEAEQDAAVGFHPARHVGEETGAIGGTQVLESEEAGDDVVCASRDMRHALVACGGCSRRR